MENLNADIKLDKRIKLLQEFHRNLTQWFDEKTSRKDKEKLRSSLNKNLIAVRSAVRDAKTFRQIIFGRANQMIDPFINLFVFDDQPLKTISGTVDNIMVVQNVLDQTEQALGVYEHIQSESGLVEITQKEAIDIETAIERALRPSFRDIQPKSEKEVQDAIENILNALGIEFTRERDTTSVGGKYYKPDFVVESLDLAIEVKLAKAGNGAAKIQEDLNADISGYRTKWKNILFVIYDLGVIIDPYKFQTDNIKLFGVSVRVIKH